MGRAAGRTGRDPPTRATGLDVAGRERPARCRIASNAEPLSLTYDDNDRFREVVGELGANLRAVGSILDVQVAQRGTTLLVAGADAAVARRLFDDLYALVGAGHPLTRSDVEQAARILRADARADLRAYFEEVVLHGVGNRPIGPRSAGQRAYLRALREHDVVFGVGPAGTGKTYLAVAYAVSLLLQGAVRRILLTRPAVEAGEKLGFLPGTLEEKVDPYLRPLYDALHDMIPDDRIARYVERGVIEVAPLAFMRGRTLAEAVVILDEAQNTSIAQMKMFLTRLGDGSRMVITGDVTQVDLPSHTPSGLVDACRVLGDVPGIAVVRFDASDVVRHPLVAAIIGAYEREEARGRG